SRPHSTCRNPDPPQGGEPARRGVSARHPAHERRSFYGDSCPAVCRPHVELLVAHACLGSRPPAVNHCRKRVRSGRWRAAALCRDGIIICSIASGYGAALLRDPYLPQGILFSTAGKDGTTRNRLQKRKPILC